MFASYVATVMKLRDMCSQKSAPYLFSKFDDRFQQRLAVVLFFHRFAMLRGTEMNWSVLSEGVYDSFARDIGDFVLGDRLAQSVYRMVHDQSMEANIPAAFRMNWSRAEIADVEREYFFHRPADGKFLPEDEKQEEEDEEQEQEDAEQEDEEREQQ